jgi:hypothetical protein
MPERLRAGILNGSERDQLILLTEQTARLAQVMEKVETRMDSMQNGSVVTLLTGHGVMESRLDRLERVVYGVCAAVALEVLALAFALFSQIRP